jgi:hypothetical protein
MVGVEVASTHPVEYSSAYFEKRLEMGDSTSSPSGETLSRLGGPDAVNLPLQGKAQFGRPHFSLSFLDTQEIQTVFSCRS